MQRTALIEHSRRVEHAPKEATFITRMMNMAIVSPGLFRVILAYVVFINHTIPIRLGTSAVYWFFMLSGFWVYRMWNKEYAHTARPYLTFVVSRFWRLLPMYVVALVLAVLIRLALGIPIPHPGFAMTWGGVNFYGSNAFILAQAQLPFEQKLIFPAWSLDIELQYYLVAPIMIFWVQRTRNFSFGRLALVALGVVGLIFLVTYYLRSAQSGILPLYLGFFLIGLHTAHLSWRPGRALALGSLGAALAIVLVCCLIPPTRALFLEGSFSGALSDYNSLADAVVALVATPYAMSTVYKVASKNHVLGRIDRDLSNVTYEIYLFHWSVAAMIGHFVGAWSKYQQLPIIVLAWIVMFPFSWLVYRLLDRPCDRLRVAYVRSRMRAASRRGGQAEIAGAP